MNVYEIINLKTKEQKYVGYDYGNAAMKAYKLNAIEQKNLESIDKYVVKPQHINNPIIYIKSEEMKYFTSITEAIVFYSEDISCFEIGYIDIENKLCPLDLTKDWVWSEESVHCKHFDDFFWNSRWQGGFMSGPGKKLKEKEVKITSSEFGFVFNRYNNLFDRKCLLDQIRKNAKLFDNNGIELIAEVKSHRNYSDFGTSFDFVDINIYYKTGRLYYYTSIML